ncbi:MAG: 30S ribosomal protein S5 [Candidatus Aenigmatarchaeota archaeon]|nr:MAG: 30S ribosomal protein S5 [Candidatus Aenigmarchaeota archaeon]
MKPGVEEWVPRTKLGRDVLEGKITSLDQIFREGKKITEPEIVDLLLPNLEHELILIGGTPGKGGGIRRTPARRTARMHKSGRRYKMTCMAVVGNRNGYIGCGQGSGTEFRDAIEKAIKDAKMNIFPVRRGCGSWECECGTPHSIPAQTTGKAGSVRTVLKPAPKGVGLVVSDEVKKLIQLSGIKDIWSKTYGQTQTRINLIKATVNAFKNLNKLKITEDFKKRSGMITGEGV